VKKILLVFLLVLIILCPVVGADGISFLGDSNMMMLQPEQEQTGAIFYENGYENLLLSVSLDWSTRGNQSIWIFPVPAKAETVSIDILKGFPTYGGNSISENYYNQIAFVTLVSASYATFPLTTPFVIVGISGATHSGFGFAGAPPSGYNDVVIHDRVDKMGIRTELVTAKNADALTAYLTGRGLSLPNDSRSMLDEYIGYDYSFVITSVENVTEYREQFPDQPRGISGHYISESNSDDVLGVSVRFPTDRIYFPLKPTRAYGDRTIPLLLTINGHVTPELPQGIKTHTTVDYLLDPSYTPPDELNTFYNNHAVVTPWPYTKIRISGPAGNYSDDLWFNEQVPPAISCQIMMTQYYPVIGVGLYILFSALSALLAGLTVFHRGSVSFRSLLQHGLWNCATMIGFVYATRHYLILKEGEYENKGRFVFVFYLYFLIMLAAVSIALVPGLIPVILMLPFVILLVLIFGSAACAYMIFSFISGREVFMPMDGTIIWSIVLVLGMLISGYGIIVIWMIRNYLKEK
jgi:hypothetical protein